MRGSRSGISILGRFDWVLLGAAALLGVMGMVTLTSIDAGIAVRQAVFWGIALVIILAGGFVSWEWLFTQRWFRHGLYWLSTALLVGPFFLSSAVRGTRSWIVVGGQQFEPSELAKIGLIVILASFFSRRYVAAWSGKNIAASLFYALVPTLIVALQPDMGSALVLAGIWFGFIMVVGVNKKRLLAGVLVCLVLLLALWFFVFKDYQKERILGFLFPERDPLGVNYNVIQSKIAIGSAGFLGKGFDKGTQIQLGFLPEAHTDFIFAAFVEEWGLLGGTVLILTYILLLIRIAIVGIRAQRNDLKFACLGSGLFFLIHFFINIGSAIGIVPVIGISLPLVSYGGSNLLTSAVLISMIERIRVTS